MGPKTITHPSTNRAGHGLTSFIRRTPPTRLLVGCRCRLSVCMCVYGITVMLRWISRSSQTWSLTCSVLLVCHCLFTYFCSMKGKGSPYSITKRRVPELIPVLGSQPAGDVSHKPGGRLPLLSTRPAVTPATLKRAACYQFCCLVDRGTMDVNSLPIDLNSCSICSNRKLDLYDINPEQPDFSWIDLPLKDQMSR